MNRYQRLTVAGREIVVYLPPSYLNTERRYPVAYVQDGGYLFTQCTNLLEHLIAEGKLGELILVGIKPHNRNDEYTPWPAEPLVSSAPAFLGKGRAYVDEVADLLKPHVDEQYRTLTGPEHTAMIGGSLGGLISLFAGYWRGETFGRIGLLSASFWYEGVLDFLREQAGLARHLRVFMSVGSCEGIYKKNAQQYMVQGTQDAYSLLLEKGLPADHLQFVVEPEGTHDEFFMTKQFPKALQWLFAEPQEQKEQVEQVAATQEVAAPPYGIPKTKQWVMQASRTGREYRIFISVPTLPPPEQGYPVLYTLDGNASFGSLAEAMRLQSRPPHGFPPAVIVSIGYDSEEPIVSERRFYDFTVQADDSEWPVRPGGKTDWPETGGVDHFIAFIEEELKPAVEQHFPIDRERQALFGHSLGGFFTLHVLFTQPELYRYYIAGSPSVWWKNHELLRQWPELEARLQRGEVQADVLITVGSEERPHMVEDAERLYKMLAPYHQQQGFQVAYRKFEGEGHVSIIQPMISPMFRWIAGRY